MPTTVSNILTYYFIESIQSINLLHCCFPGKSINFSEAASGGVLLKKPFLKISQYSQDNTLRRLQHSCFPLDIANF